MGYKDFQTEMEAAAVNLTNVEFVELNSFANPFAGWVQVFQFL